MAEMTEADMAKMLEKIIDNQHAMMMALVELLHELCSGQVSHRCAAEVLKQLAKSLDIDLEALMRERSNAH